MTSQRKLFNIAILEDNEFYNSLFTKLITYYAETLRIKQGCYFEIGSFLSAQDFINKLSPNTDLVFLDYYLDNGITAPDIMDEINKKCKKCRIVILSKTQNTATELNTITNGAMEFIYKDSITLPKSCAILEDLANDQL